MKYEFQGNNVTECKRKFLDLVWETKQKGKGKEDEKLTTGKEENLENKEPEAADNVYHVYH